MTAFLILHEIFFHLSRDSNLQSDLLRYLAFMFLFLSHNVVIERIGALGWLASTGMAFFWGAVKNVCKYRGFYSKCFAA